MARITERTDEVNHKWGDVEEEDNAMASRPAATLSSSVYHLGIFTLRLSLLQQHVATGGARWGRGAWSLPFFSCAETVGSNIHRYS